MPVRPALFALLAFLVPSLARAEAAAPPELELEELRDVAITVAPANLLLGMVKVNGELRIRDEWGLQVSLGGGRIEKVSIREAGGQLRWYVLGDFDHGMQLGLEVMFIELELPPLTLDEAGVPVDIDPSVLATAIGPFLGYKVAFDGGFTLEAQLGLQRYGVDTTGGVSLSRLHEDLDGVTAAVTYASSFYAPLANLNLGWSF